MPRVSPSLIFISPSVREGGRLQDALFDLGTIAQENFEKAAEAVSGGVVPGCCVRRAIGVWLDGAEPSACIEVPGSETTLDDLQYIAAVLGVEFAQKDALVFRAEIGGADRMHSFATASDLWEIDRIVRAADIEHRTYVLSEGALATVYVFDNGFDPDLLEKMKRIGERYGYAIKTQEGTGDFVTDFAEGREQGKDIFLQLIDEYERGYPDRKRSVR